MFADYTTAPLQDFSGFWGRVSYIWNGGIVDGLRYNWDGEPVGISPVMGVAPDVGMGRIIKTATSLKKTVVIGQNMSKRVIPFAEKYGYKYFKPRGTNPKFWMKNQVQWIKRQIKDPGTRIIDIGPDELLPPSKYYLKELEMIKKYLGL